MKSDLEWKMRNTMKTIVTLHARTLGSESITILIQACTMTHEGAL